MENSMDYELNIKLRNARLLNRIKGKGFKSVREFALTSGINYQSVASAVALKLTVFDKKFNVRRTPSLLADYFGCSPVELFPEESWYEQIKKTSETVQLSSNELKELTFSSNEGTIELEDKKRDLAKLITSADLSNRQKKVISMRYVDGSTLEECANNFGLSRERIRQVEYSALRKIRIESSNGDYNHEN